MCPKPCLLGCGEGLVTTDQFIKSDLTRILSLLMAIKSHFSAIKSHLVAIKSDKEVIKSYYCLLDSNSE